MNYKDTKPYLSAFLNHTSSQANGQDDNQGSAVAFRPLGSVLPRPVFSMSTSPVKNGKGEQSLVYQIDRRWI